MIKDEYLGDGVYASFDGYHIVLDLRAQALPGGHVCKIGLEPAVLGALERYRLYVADTLKEMADADRDT